MCTNVKQHCNCQSQNNFSTLNITLTPWISNGRPLTKVEGSALNCNIFYVWGTIKHLMQLSYQCTTSHSLGNSLHLRGISQCFHFLCHV